MLETAHAHAILARVARARAARDARPGLLPPRPVEPAAPLELARSAPTEDRPRPLFQPRTPIQHASAVPSVDAPPDASAIKEEPAALFVGAAPAPSAEAGPSRQPHGSVSVSASPRRSTSALSSPPLESIMASDDNGSSSNASFVPQRPRDTPRQAVSGKGAKGNAKGTGKGKGKERERDQGPASGEPSAKKAKVAHPLQSPARAIRVPGGKDRDGPLRPPSLPPPPPVLPGANRSLDEQFCFNCGYRRPDDYSRSWRNWIGCEWYERVPDKDVYRWPERPTCGRCCDACKSVFLAQLSSCALSRADHLVSLSTAAVYDAVWRELSPKTGLPYNGGNKRDRPRACQLGLDWVDERRRLHFMGDLRHHFGGRTLTLPHNGGPVEDLERIEVVSDAKFEHATSKNKQPAKVSGRHPSARPTRSVSVSSLCSMAISGLG